MLSQKVVAQQESDLCRVELTLTETVLLMNLIKASEYNAIVTQADNDLRNQLRLIHEKLNNS
jgi:hypothetical protein